MTKTAFDRDNVLNDDERIASARKCIKLLLPELDRMNNAEQQFVDDMDSVLDQGRPTERQLAWLRDLVEKYAQ
jgi:hypothetical protein